MQNSLVSITKNTCSKSRGKPPKKISYTFRKNPKKSHKSFNLVHFFRSDLRWQYRWSAEIFKLAWILLPVFYQQWKKNCLAC